MLQIQGGIYDGQKSSLSAVWPVGPRLPGRRLDESSTIIVVERGEYISFANCGLPYYIGETIKDRDKLMVQTVPGLSRRYELDIRNLSEVTSILRDEKMVMIKTLLPEKPTPRVMII